MLVIWYGMSIAICHPAVVVVPPLCTSTLALKPPLQESVTLSCPPRPPDVAGGVEGGVTGGVVGGVEGGGVVGVVSSSMMVAVPVPLVMVAPAASLSTPVNCSLGSASVSGVTGMEMVCGCWPVAKVTEPLVGVKSLEAAVPGTLWK